MTEASGPKLLVTGFGPFPGAPENPTAHLVAALAQELPEKLGASALRAVVLPTDHKRSWATLRRLNAGFDPDVVVHFGLSQQARAITIERVGCRRLRPGRPDASGFTPPSGLARRSGPDRLPATVPVEAIVGALRATGHAVTISDDAGGYVCDATLYRSLAAVPAGRNRLVGFVHVPLFGVDKRAEADMLAAAVVILRTTAEAWPRRSRC